MKRWLWFCTALLICTLTFAGVRPLSTRASGDIWVRASSGLSYSTIVSIAIDPVTTSTLYISGNYGDIYRSDNKGLSWNAIALLPNIPTCLTVDPMNPNSILAGSRYGSSGPAFRSDDGGSTWWASSGGFPQWEWGSGVLCLVWDPVAPGVLYAGTTAGVYRSADHGNSWFLTCADFTSVVNALAIDPKAPQNLYAGTDVGVFRSGDGGATWAPASNGLDNLGVLSLVIDPLTPAVLYCGTAYGVLRTDDSGATWASVSSVQTGFVSAPWLAIDPSDPSTLYAGTSFYPQVFRSDDGGGTWFSFSTGLTPWCPVSCFAMDPLQPAILYAGLTIGGFWTAQPSLALVTDCSPTQAGSIARNPDQTSFLAGSVVQLTAQSHFGYRFVGWSGDASGTENSLTVMMDTEKTVTANFALDACAVALTAPNGSEQWAPGTTHDIAWTVTGNADAIGQFGLYLALDGSDPWEQIAWYVGSADRSFSWTVPDILTSRAKIAVCALDSSSNMLAWDASDSFFSINSVTKGKLPIVTITSSSKKPWQAGASRMIQWHVNGTLPKSFHHYSIWASLEDGRNDSWTHLGNSTTSSFPWYVPLTVGSAYVRVIVYAMDVSSHVVAGAQSELFSIMPATGAYGIVITAPVGGQTLHPAQALDVTWSTTGTVPPSIAYYMLYYSVNGGLSWQFAAAAWWADSVSCTWNLPYCDSSNCRVMIVAQDYSGNTVGVAVSTVPFSIVP